MKPTETGKLYDKISAWWNDNENHLTMGVDFLQKALKFSAGNGKALDVGCGSGGRIINALLDTGFQVTGIEVSEAQLENARKRYSDSNFILADICEWEIEEQYDVVIAWDSIFHVPYSEQRPVVQKLCSAMAPGGVLLFTAGGVDGQITGEMRGLNFYYSSLDEEEYLKAIKENGCECILMERDQYPARAYGFYRRERADKKLAFLVPPRRSQANRSAAKPNDRIRQSLRHIRFPKLARRFR